MRILVVEDDKIIGDGIVSGLEMDGYAADWVEDVETAKNALDTTSYDMMVLDIGLPDGSGFDVLKYARGRGLLLPVLILTAYDDTSYKVKGLDAGADDYLVKPFKLEEILARLRALRRRMNGRSSLLLEIGNVTLDPSSHAVCVDGNPVAIGAKEFSILHALMERAGQIVTREQLVESLYGWNTDVESNTIEVHIHGLRRKLGKDFIKTIRNVGYLVSDQ